MEAKRQILDEKEQMDMEAADDILYGENESSSTLKRLYRHRKLRHSGGAGSDS